MTKKTFKELRENIIFPATNVEWTKGVRVWRAYTKKLPEGLKHIQELYTQASGEQYDRWLGFILERAKDDAIFLQRDAKFKPSDLEYLRFLEKYTQEAKTLIDVIVISLKEKYNKNATTMSAIDKKAEIEFVKILKNFFVEEVKRLAKDILENISMLKSIAMQVHIELEEAIDSILNDSSLDLTEDRKEKFTKIEQELDKERNKVYIKKQKEHNRQDNVVYAFSRDEYVKKQM